MAPLMLLACVNKIFELAVFSVSVKMPVAEAACVSAPVCVMLPLAVRFKAPLPTEDAPKRSAVPFTSETA